MNCNRLYPAAAAIAAALAAVTPIAAQPCLNWQSAAQTPSIQAAGSASHDAANDALLIVGANSLGVMETWLWSNEEWRLQPADGPSRRAGHAVMGDAARGQVLLFGGYQSSSYFDDTWIWNGASWTLASVPGPTPRTESNLAYDSARGVVVLYGGRDSGGWKTDTWEWNGSAWHMRAEAGPTPRTSSAMTYDAARGEVVLFGGRDATGEVGDTWIWNGIVWSLAATTGPSPRRLSGIAFDAARGETVLFGGVANGVSLGDTWIWNGATWTERFSEGPPSTWNPGMVFDASSSRILLFGGSNRTDLWSWNGEIWQRLHSGGPGPLRSSEMVFDSDRGVVVMFGGTRQLNNGSGYDGRTWEWDGEAWLQRHIAGPGPRASHGMAFDRDRGVTVLHAGVPNPNAIGFNFHDTWEYDGDEWQLKQVVPTYRTDLGIACDTARNTLVLFSRRIASGEIFEWTGGSWRLVSDDIPDAEGACAVYDPLRQNTLYLTNNSQSVTYLWDGSSVATRAVPGPPGANFANAVWHGGRETIVLFGGGGTVSPRNDLWEWNGQSWAQIAVAGPRPPVRYNAGLAYDAARDRIVLFGGQNSTSLRDTWEWDGQTWSQVAADAPFRLIGRTMVYDLSRDRCVAVGVAVPSPGELQTWEWDGTAWSLVASGGTAARSAASMVFDSVTSRPVLFGGNGDQPGGSPQSWAFDSGEWRLLNDDPYSGTMVYDSRLSATILLGNSASGNETWLWNGQSWERIALGGPGAVPVVDDKANGVLVAVRQAGVANTTWTWDGLAWTNQGPAPFALRSAYSLHYDSARSRVVLHGGKIGDVVTNETWEWDGSNWRQSSSTGPARFNHAAEFDEARGEAVVYGGNEVATAYYALDDTWITLPAVLAGDVNSDGRVDLSDLTTLLSNFGSTGTVADEGDLDDDGDVDLGDLLRLLTDFGQVC